MTVYIDDMYRYPLGQFGRMKMSHMFAEQDEELHLMADKIGVSRRWYQGDHYDVSMTKRDLAIQNGAVPVTLNIAAKMMLQKRSNGVLPKPGEVIDPRVKKLVAETKPGRIIRRTSR
jgi:hypothetical protein